MKYVLLDRQVLTGFPFECSMCETSDCATWGEALSMMCLHSGPSRKLETSMTSGLRLRVISSKCSSSAASPEGSKVTFRRKPISTPGQVKLPPSKTSTSPETSAADCMRTGVLSPSTTLKKAKRPDHLPFFCNTCFTRPCLLGFSKALRSLKTSSKPRRSLGGTVVNSSQSVKLPPTHWLMATLPAPGQEASPSPNALEQDDQESPTQRTW
mmetsp:Transcript_79871/g.247771  ORF Transcript_79871/g.247771 Transcript_79871/m.247771 type:complete len:211 (-) Transcript_79871:159-791(-)